MWLFSWNCSPLFTNTLCRRRIEVVLFYFSVGEWRVLLRNQRETEYKWMHVKEVVFRVAGIMCTTRDLGFTFQSTKNTRDSAKELFTDAIRRVPRNFAHLHIYSMEKKVLLRTDNIVYTTRSHGFTSCPTRKEHLKFPPSHPKETMVLRQDGTCDYRQRQRGKGALRSISHS